MPKTESERIFYGKEKSYDKNIKDKIVRSDSLMKNGETNYVNGTVKVFIPWNILNTIALFILYFLFYSLIIHTKIILF